MKILHILYAGLGGHGNVFFSMVSADSKHEFDFEALFYGIEDIKEEYIEKCKAQNIKVHFVKKKRGLDLSFYTSMARKMAENDADILFLHGSSNIISAGIAKLKSKKIKIIVRETQSNKLKDKRDWIWLRLAFVLADKLVLLSNQYQQELIKKFRSAYKFQKVEVIPNGVDLDLFCPLKKPGPPSINFVIGMQSRLVKIKDYETLIRAMEILNRKKLRPKYLLKIAGEGDDKMALQNMVNNLGLGDIVEFVGMLDEAELVNFLQGLDIYVHATLGETMSTAIMQAMACGKPIIASNVNGVNNMITDGTNGLLVPPKNIDAMANAIKLLLSEKERANELASNAHKLAIEKYSNITMFEKYKIIFNGWNARI